MRPFRDLAVWQEAHPLALEIYRETKKFPREEVYGLTSQLRRAATSIPANIVEGSVFGDTEFRRSFGSHWVRRLRPNTCYFCHSNSDTSTETCTRSWRRR